MSKAAELAALIGGTSGSSLSNRNLIINGAMQVAQRSTSLTVGDSTEYKTLDRFAIAINGTTAGRATMSQATDAPNGFGNSMKFDVTTADTSIGASEAFGFAQRIEGQNLQQLAKGTADAKVSTLSFYAKGTAKTYIVEVRDANSRQVSATFDVTTSWQRFEIEIPADTTGTIANDNSTELQILWWLHAGSDYTSGTLNTSWATSTNANRMVGCDSIFDSTSNELLITGIQLEVGEQATPFEHRSYGDELLACMRYYQQIGGELSNVLCTGQCTSSTLAQFWIPFIVPVRDDPTCSVSDQTHFRVFNAAVSGIPDTTNMTIAATNAASHGGFRIQATVGSGLVAGNATMLSGSDSDSNAGIIKMDAEL